MAFPLTEQK